ncbi:MAG: cytochrome c oxidase subunit II [Actinomycetota bacterium]
MAGAALAAQTACNSNFGLPDSGTEQAEHTTDLWRLYFLIALGIGALVWLLIIWSVVRYRRRSDAMPKQTMFNIPLEIVYTVVPLVIVGFLFVATLQTLNQVSALADEPDLTVEVTGFQWQWRFVYPERNIDTIGQTDDPAELVLPEQATVRIELTSADVIHSFWVPEFMIKRDAIPGQPNAFDMAVTDAGFYDSGRCVEYCGLNHDQMSFNVRVLPQAEFETWAADNRAGTP